MEKLINEIKQAKNIAVPKWSKLVKEYDPTKHKVRTDREILKDIVKADGVERSARVVYGKQRLAVRRMTQMAFSIPVKRIYNIGDDEVKIAQAKAMEAIYKRARIDAVNIKRMAAYFACCEMATIWFPVKAKNNYYGFESDYKLNCISFSPMEEKYSRISQAEIYPVFDKYRDLVKLAFEYTIKEGKENVKYFQVYEAEKDVLYRNKNGKWEQVDEPSEVPIGKIPAIYLWRPIPIYEDITDNVTEIELSLSRESNILRKNSAPILGIRGKLLTGKATGEVAREVYQIEGDGGIEYITWQQQIEAMKYYIETLDRKIDEELQLPNFSLENVKGLGNVTGEARKTLLTEPHLKVGDESGDIIEALERECNVIKAFLGKMNRKWADSIGELEVEHVITPFIQNDEASEIDKVTKATQKPVMAQKTGIKILGMVDDVDAEYQLLQEEAESERNQDLFTIAE